MREFHAESGTRTPHILPAVASEYRFRPRCHVPIMGAPTRSRPVRRGSISRIRRGGGSCLPLRSLRRSAARRRRNSARWVYAARVQRW